MLYHAAQFYRIYVSADKILNQHQFRNKLWEGGGVRISGKK